MVTIIRSNERGLGDQGWLKSRFSFSFADYYEPSKMGFGVLRVINEDWIKGGTGFRTHPHRDMEIISYVIDGALEHKDSMGTEIIIRPGEIQRMSAGTGVRHSEFNHLKNQESHILQIWIMPEKMSVTPSYDQKSFAEELLKNEVVLVASKEGRDGSITINQDVDLYACKASEAGEKSIMTKKKRNYWLQVINGVVKFENQVFEPGDGASFENLEKDSLSLEWEKDSEFLFFDLPNLV